MNDDLAIRNRRPGRAWIPALIALLAAAVACNFPGQAATDIATEVAPVPVTPDEIPQDEPAQDGPAPADGVQIGNTVYVGVSDESQVDPVVPIDYGNLVYQQPFDVSPLAFVSVDSPPDVEPTRGVHNSSGTWQALVIHDPGDGLSGQDQVFVEDVASGQWYEVTEIPLPERPISQMAWVDDELLVFDRWSQPHFGWRYLVNVVSGEAWSASLADEFFVQQGGQP